MELQSMAQAGTLESSDMMVLIKPLPSGEGRKIEIESSVKFQYGNDILQEVTDILDQFEIADAKIHINDKGALTPVIRARMETAIKRSLNQQEGTLKDF